MTTATSLLTLAALVWTATGAAIEDAEMASSITFGYTQEASTEGKGADITATSYCVAEHNRERARNGKPPLTADSRLETAAARHNEVMQRQNCFSHQCPGEPGPFDRMTQAGYRWSGAGENIFKGPLDCNAAVAGWMNSEGHRKNIVGNFKHIGCAKLGAYYTCDFGNPA